MYLKKDQLALYFAGIENCSFDGTSLFLHENNKSYKIDSSSISDVRIMKSRVLFLNYFFVVILSLLLFIFSDSISNSFSNQVIVFMVCLITVIASLKVKIYKHELLINTTDLNFVKVTVIYKDEKIAIRTFAQLFPIRRLSSLS